MLTLYQNGSLCCDGMVGPSHAVTLNISHCIISYHPPASKKMIQLHFSLLLPHIFLCNLYQCCSASSPPHFMDFFFHRLIFCLPLLCSCCSLLLLSLPPVKAVCCFYRLCSLVLVHLLVCLRVHIVLCHPTVNTTSPASVSPSMGR